MNDPSLSLPFALRSIAGEADHEVEVDDLAAVLGLCWMVCAVPGEPDVGNWSMYARDAFLVKAGRLFGMQIREIHPPEAARGLERATEFGQHFQASYRPLVLRALEHGQPVLAWQGWPGERRLWWGVIREACDAGIGLRGETLADASRSAKCDEQVLDRPPIQLYVVEVVSAAWPGTDELLEAAVRHAHTVLNNGLSARFGVVTGPEALDVWIARLKAAGTGEGLGSLAGAAGSDSGCNTACDWLSDQRRLAAGVMACHQAGARFLDRCPAGRQRLAEAVNALRGLTKGVVHAMDEVLRLLYGSRAPAALTSELVATLTTARRELAAGLVP